MKEEKHLFKKFGQSFPAGTMLFEEGEPCTGMYIIQKGRVRLFKKAAGQEMTIDVLGEGDFFGEMACLMGHPRSINAVVEEDSQILLVDPEIMEQLFRESSGLSLKILGHLAGRLKKSYALIERLVAELERIRAGDN